MSRYAPVMPIEVAKWFKDQNALGDYHLLLAHDVVQHPEKYTEVYAGITDQPEGVIIMDNSVIELGEPVKAEIMRKAIDIVKANVVVLPDMLLDRQKTIEAVTRGVNDYADAGIWTTEAGCSALAIPQGHSLSDWIKCLEEIVNLDYYGMIEWIGIPKNLNEKLGVSRMRAVDAVKMICPGKKCHMFGFSDDLFDDIMSTRYGDGQGLVEGIDSAAPIWTAVRDGYLLSLSGIPGKRGDWWDNPFKPAEHLLGVESVTLDLRVSRAIDNAERIQTWLR